VGVERLEADQVSEEAVEALGLDRTAVDVASPEALSASLRRAASFLCPTTLGSLVRAVAEVLDGLPGFTDDIKSQLEQTGEALVSSGDLLELPVDDGGRRRRQLFLGPPAFVHLSGTCLLIGVRPDGAPLVGDDLLKKVANESHVRFIRSTNPDIVVDMLHDEGLVELQPDQWLRAPRQSTAKEVVASYCGHLDAAGPSGDIAGVRVIDPVASVVYYSGRWRPLKHTDSGRFIARRPQAFGADLWCFADVERGAIVKLIDLPLDAPLAPAADEAWRLQAAIDALAGTPQQVRVRVGTDGHLDIVDFFSPIPSWAQRRLDVVGTPLLRSKGALISYRVPEDEVAGEARFLEEMMWLTVKPASRKD
jgi:hypothetical protein